MRTKPAITKWIKYIFMRETIPDGIIALNFGLFESVNGYMVYCIGSKKYDKDDDDWACYEDFIPIKKYFTSGKSFTNLNWRTYLTKMGELLKEVIYKNESLIPSSVDYITCGYDEGELYVVWLRGQDKSEIGRVQAPEW